MGFIKKLWGKGIETAEQTKESILRRKREIKSKKRIIVKKKKN